MGQPEHARTQGRPPQSSLDTTASVPAPASRVRIDISWSAIFKVVGTIAGLIVAYQLRTIVLMVFLGLLLAMVLERPVGWLNRRGLPRGPAIAGVLGGAIIGGGLLLAYLIPTLARDLRDFWNQVPVYVESTLSWLQERQPALYDVTIRWADAQRQNLDASGFDVQGLLSAGVGIVGNLTTLVMVLVITVYLLVDNGNTIDSMLKYVPPKPADKLRRTFPEVGKVVNGYVAGQAFNSSLFAIFVLVVLSVLDVPSAAVMALIAAIGDAIPQVGVTLATIPAVLLALTVSFQAAMIVLAAYIAYQGVENYVTSPRVFGKALDLSPLVTMVAVLVGGVLMGIIGVLLALPVAAAIPVLMRIWLEEPEHDGPAGNGTAGDAA